jgi:L-rhamnose mutarotase
MKTYCLALDLVDDPELIAAYEKHHEKIWPEITQSITDSGITSMKIYRVSNRLFMVIKAVDDFSFASKNEKDKRNPKVVAWENLMSQYQQIIPGTPPGKKWRLMDKIFDLKKNG